MLRFRTLAPLMVAVLLGPGCVVQDQVGEVPPPPDGSDPLRPCADQCECDTETCHRVCAGEDDADCEFHCRRGQECRFGCPGGLCNMRCDPLTSCGLGCEGGDCVSRCDGTKNCGVDCPSGGCRLTCNDSESCVMNCPGGFCQLICSGARSCVMTGCEVGCLVDCGGARECVSSCERADDCVVIP